MITDVSMGSVSSITPLSGFKEALRCLWKRGLNLITPLSGTNEDLRCPWKRGLCYIGILIGSAIALGSEICYARLGKYLPTYLHYE